MADATIQGATHNEFMVHNTNGVIKRFRESEPGLYYLDMSKEKHVTTTLISTVVDNKYKYTNADYSKALLARSTQKIICRPSLWTYLQSIDKKRLKNCPVTRADILAAKYILGPEVGYLKGNNVHIGAESA